MASRRAPAAHPDLPLWKRPVVLIVLLALGLNVNTLTHSWALDDTLLITDNRFTQQGFAGIPQIWSSDVFTGYFGTGGVEEGGRYRPLSQTVFAICHGTFGAHPFPGHLLNVVLYAFTCALLFRFLQRILPVGEGTGLWNIPFLATLLYTAHPVHCEVVANIKSLDEILAMALSLLCALALLRWAGNGKALLLLLGALSFFLALTAKENAVTFLVVVPLALFMAHADNRRIGLATASLLVPLGIYLALRSAVIDTSPELVQADNFLTDPFFGATTTMRLATVCLTWWRYLLLILFPITLTTDHYPAMIPVVGWDSPQAWLGLLLFAGAGLWGLWKLRARSVPAFGALYFLTTFSVVSNLVIDVGTPQNDRFLFMPLAGATVVMAWAFTRSRAWSAKWASMDLARGTVLLVLMLLSIRTVVRNADWKDDLTLFTQDVEVSASSARCNVMMGKLLYEHAATERDPRAKARDLERAAHHLKRGIEIYPGYFLAWGILGIMEMDRGNDREAAKLFIESLRIERTEVALTNLGHVGRRMFTDQDAAGARMALEAVKGFDPKRPDPYLLLADMKMRTGRADSSLLLLDELIALDPDLADAHRMKGEVLAVYLGRPLEAEESFKRAHALDPTNVAVIENLGVAAFSRGDAREALTYFLRAVDLRPNDAHLLQNVASTYERLGDQAQMQAFRDRARAATATGN